MLRLSTPAHYTDWCEHTFGYPDWLASNIVRQTAIQLCDRWWERLARPRWLNGQRLQRYAAAIQAKNCPIQYIVGFVRSAAGRRNFHR